MSITSTLKEAVGLTPTYTSEEREEARATARAAAKPGDWLSQILDHHVQLEQAFAAVKATRDAASRTTAQKKLAVLLTGHANAEESVIYPAMEMTGEDGDVSHAFKEQAEAKIQMAMLDAVPDKMSSAYTDKLEEIRLAVVHHMMHEEKEWFPGLAENATPEQDAKATKLYREEFDRYVHDDA